MWKLACQHGWYFKPEHSSHVFHLRSELNWTHETPLTCFAIEHPLGVNMDAITFAERSQPPRAKA